jgi:hypothetical protein
MYLLLSFGMSSYDMHAVLRQTRRTLKLLCDQESADFTLTKLHLICKLVFCIRNISCRTLSPLLGNRIITLNK